MAMDNCFPDLPTWCPPTPPISPGQMQNDLYYDDCLDLLYDPDFMGESRLPNVIHDLHRPLMRTPSPVKKQPPTPSLGSSKNKAVMDLLNAATQSACSSASQSPMYTNDSTYYPEFGFQVPDYGTMDPFAQPRKEKRDRSGKGDRGAEQAIRQSREAPRPITPPPLMHEAEDYEGPEWNIMEDMAIVEAVEIEEALGHVASRPQGALQYNWRYISDYVNMRTAPTGHYRSARQCCIRYQVVVRPREAGHLHTVDPITRKPRKVPVTPAELAHLKKNRTTTKAQFDHDYPLMMESVCVNKARLLKDLNKRNKKPQKSYLDALPAVADTKMPDNFEAKLQELKLAGALRTVLPEDMVRKQEEVHFLSVEAQSKQRATEKQLDTDVQKGMPASIAIRSSAIPAQGTRESKAPYMLEMPVIHATKPLPPPPRSVPLSNVHTNTSIPQLMPADHPVSHQTTIGTSQGPRRVTNPTMSHMVSNSSGGHNYVVVNDHPNAMRVQRTETIGQQGNVPLFRGVQGQVRRAPTNTPMNQRPVNYVSSQGGQGGNYITSQQGTGNATMYSGPMTQQSRPVPPNSRVITRPGTQPNRIFVNSDRTGQYVMQQGHVRVVGAGQGVQRVQQGPSSGGVPPSQGIKRVAPKPGTVTTMVLPAGARPPGQPGQMQQFRTIRTVQRGVSGPQQGPRVMNVVMGGGGPMRTASGHLVSSQGGMTRQLLTSRTTIPTSRQGSPQTIAQVVIAPPTGLQQSQQRDLLPSQPPTLTPQQIDPHPPPGRNSPQVQHVAVPVSSAPTASAPHDGPSPE